MSGARIVRKSWKVDRKADIVDGPCCVRVSVSSTGPCGGDAGHGALARVVIEDRGSFALTAGVDAGERGPLFEASTVTIVVEGDWDASYLATALYWAAFALEEAGARMLTVHEVEGGGR